jgi:ABC-type amino acid transport substrate-binding protein
VLSTPVICGYLASSSSSSSIFGNELDAAFQGRGGRTDGDAAVICYKIVDEVKATLKLDKLKIELTPVSSATRIPLIGNGTIDLECASTTNNLEREKLVAFRHTYFLTANRFVAKTSSGLKIIDDLKGCERPSRIQPTAAIPRPTDLGENLGQMSFGETKFVAPYCTALRSSRRIDDRRTIY